MIWVPRRASARKNSPDRGKSHHRLGAIGRRLRHVRDDLPRLPADRSNPACTRSPRLKYARSIIGLRQPQRLPGHH